MTIISGSLEYHDEKPTGSNTKIQVGEHNRIVDLLQTGNKGINTGSISIGAYGEVINSAGSWVGPNVEGANTMAEQAFTSSTSWEFTHGFNTGKIMVQAFDSLGSEIDPQTSVPVDNNTWKMTFSPAQAGTMRVMTAGALDVGKYQTTLSGASSYTITHNLKDLNPIPTFYNDAGSRIIEDDFVIIDQNSARADFATTFTGSATIAGGARSGGGVTDHTLLDNIGTNSHATIDAHILSTGSHGGDLSADVAMLHQEAMETRIDVIELRANTGTAPFDHTHTEVETYSSAEGLGSTVDTGSTTLAFNSTDKTYDFQSEALTLVDDFESGTLASLGYTGAALNGQANVTGGYLRCYSPTTASSDYATAYKAFGNKSTFDYYFRLRVNGGATNSPVFVEINSSNTTSTAPSGCYFGFTTNSTTVNLTDGGGTTIGTGQSYTNNVWTWYRMQHDGNNLRGKIWTGTIDDEPASWTWDGSSTNVGAGDKVRFYCYGNNVPGDITVHCDEYYTYQGGAVTGTQKVQHDLPSETGSITHVQMVVNETLGSPDTSHFDLYDASGSSIGSLEMDTKYDVTGSLTGNPTRMDYVIDRPYETDDEAYIKTWCLKYWKS